MFMQLSSLSIADRLSAGACTVYEVQIQNSVSDLHLDFPSGWMTEQRSRVLGSGAYGVVKAIKLNADQDIVAVKTLRARASALETDSFYASRSMSAQPTPSRTCTSCVHSLSCQQGQC